MSFGTVSNIRQQKEKRKWNMKYRHSIRKYSNNSNWSAFWWHHDDILNEAKDEICLFENNNNKYKNVNGRDDKWCKHAIAKGTSMFSDLFSMRYA